MRGVRRDERREAAPGLRRCSARAACTMATAPPLCAGGGPHRAARPSPPPHLPRTWHASRAASGPPSLPELLAPPKLAAAARACCRMRRRWESACRRVTSASCSAASTLALDGSADSGTFDQSGQPVRQSGSMWRTRGARTVVTMTLTDAPYRRSLATPGPPQEILTRRTPPACGATSLGASHTAARAPSAPAWAAAADMHEGP